ncbi:hypothetical protein K6W36_02355 [Acetobacter senegalensis]|uniref:hypothetical protein n=1 Tax=Acetobacter senegalensis TaxID=446692 RepID=UPI001EDBE415|nr:hypothetical protein [Acetobacter senegalensis]MCG4259429.1 hypothetical protein [Acetobacter senegalensis]
MAHMPLTEWRCDKCGGAVDAHNGWVEWESGSVFGPRNFHIVHNSRACSFHDSSPLRKDCHIRDFLGVEGAHNLQALVQPPSFFVDNFAGGKWQQPDLREFYELCRRLQVPYYEEARPYFNVAYSQGEMDGANETTISSPDFCKRIYDIYGE